MGREIRQVPPNWEHPRNKCGHYKPMLDQTYARRIFEHIWYDLPYYLKHPRYIKEWFEEWPNKEVSRPRWQQKPTHFQIYETVSEGTPVSPVFATEKEIVEWLITQGHSRHASEEFVKNKWVMSMVLSPHGIAIDIDIYDLPNE